MNRNERVWTDSRDGTRWTVRSFWTPDELMMGQVVFESCAIPLYLANKTGKLFYAYGTPQYWEALEWLFFQAACVGPFFGQRAHFVWFAPERVPYGLKRYTKESERLYGVIDGRLAGRKYFMGDDYTIVDIAHYAWVYTHKVMGFSFAGFDNMKAWYERIDARRAAQKGIYVPKKIMDLDLENGGHRLTAEEMAA